MRRFTSIFNGPPLLTVLVLTAPLLATLLLGACAPGLSRQDAATVESLARPARLMPHVRQGGQFALTTRERIDGVGQDLTIYIEGDGVAWASRTLPSNDPTPDMPVSLALAALDPSPNVAWIARPCQYLPVVDTRTCPVYFWTHGRLAPEVVDSMDAVVTQVKAAARAQRVHLVGYSGGGGLAVLVAARRSDVASIRTVAANLDTDAFTRLHQVSPMAGSLNPASVARRVETIPQLHLVGAADKIVPGEISRAYLAAMLRRDCSKIEMVPGATHQDGWVAAWPPYARTVPACPGDVRGKSPAVAPLR